MNRELSCKSGVGPLKSATGDTITDDISKASALNKYFVTFSVFTIDDGNSPDFVRRVGDDVSMHRSTVLSFRHIWFLNFCPSV